MSSLKRKSTGNPSSDASKKPKTDFFAPRLAKTATKSDEGPNFSIRPPPDACVRLTTWNVNGIMSVNEKLLKKYLETEDPGILILTETKYAKGKPDLMCLKSRFKYQYWGVDPRPGHAGTAVLSKFKPLKVSTGLPDWEETTGRKWLCRTRIRALYVVGTYVPNSGENFKTMDLKRKWNSVMKNHLQRLESRKPVIWAGDFNSIMSKKDLDSTAQSFWNQMSGLSEEERAGFGEILQPEASHEPIFVDVWRHLHPTEEEYTHSSMKFGSWRLDSFITSATLLEKVNSCQIRNEIKDLNLSDHWPVTLDIAVDVSPKSEGQKGS